MDANTKIDGRRLRIIAVHSDGTDEATVARYLRGLPVRPGSAARIERGLRELGLDVLIRVVVASPLDGLTGFSPMAISSLGGVR